MFTASITSFFLKENDGYYSFTKHGTIVMIVIAVLIIAAGIILARKLKDDGDEDEFSKKKKKDGSGKRKDFGTKKLVVCAVCLALAYVTSNIKFLELYNGGSITLFSMLFVVYIGYCFGIKTGILCGLAYGILQLIQDPWLLSPMQVFFDYILAFAVLGLGGLFRNLKEKNKETGEKRLTKKGLIIGYAAAAFLRAISHTIGGYLFWMDGMPDSFPKSISFLYPIAYNFCYIGVEAVLTVVLLLIPEVAAVLIRLRREANS